MNKNLIARTSITINAPRGKTWNALVNPDAIQQYMSVQMLSPTGMKGVRSFGKESGRVNRMRTRG
jgi:uncharacterized protein YndB with AHSA1/START domain